MSDLKVVVIAGAAGRMGLANLRAVLKTGGLKVSGAIERSGSDAIGKDVGTLAGLDPLGVLVTDDVEQALEGAEALLDFTTPATSVALAQQAARRGMIHVIGTTGCSAEDETSLRAAGAAGAVIVKSGNFSLGVNLLVELTKKAASVLGPDWDAEVIEMHHNRKVDAPSGTALMLGKAVADGRSTSFDDKAVYAREGHTGPREKGAIGFATLRGGNVIGEHSVYLVGPNERIELSHKAQDRALFADGAVRALLWARNKPKGYYSMADVLGF
jgi:4-hydroxy-tetrahydrodipicolinate reductase